MIQQTFLNTSLFTKIKNIVEADSFPWYYANTTAYNNNDRYGTLYNGSFGHIALNNGKKNSEVADALEDYFLCMTDTMGIKVNFMHRIRIGMIPVCPIYNVNPPHIDFPFPHKVGLLYLNESDGDTVIYNEKYDSQYGSEIYYYDEILKKNLTVRESITPEENKLAIFDGLCYHSSSTPVWTKRRIVVNYVFDGDI